MKKTFTIKLQGKDLENMEKNAESEFRSVTQQIQKIVSEFIKNNPIEQNNIKNDDMEDVFK